MQKNAGNWPELSYEEFKPTLYLLHMTMQVFGKLKLNSPFESHWANLILRVTSHGLTTGLIPYLTGAFSLEVDFCEHKIILTTTWGNKESFDLTSMSVAQMTKNIFDLLDKANISLTINFMPQEVINPMAFDQDKSLRMYNSELANSWWRILLKSQLVMEHYHAFFDGESPPIGVMWGTLDLRDARYNGVKINPTGPNAGYLRRNAMNEEQVEVGFWAGNEIYPRPAYFSFTYPQPQGIENAKIQPAAAHWNSELFEFILDYDDVRNSDEPEKNLLDFFQSSYQVGSKLAGWKKELITLGEPV